MSEVHVHLPEIPFWPNDVATEDLELLDRLGSEFACGRGRDAPEVARFLYGDLPIAAFDRIFDGGFADLGTGAILWMFHVSGYLRRRRHWTLCGDREFGDGTLARKLRNGAHGRAKGSYRAPL